ncbi:hypothetical protein GA0070621_0934 [Micromonospora narathiwatensis]|uniref:Uncharacterized protein n=1 Tax=Micromonospora narathiwatensis TaxID=299146 RepID=A0A1A8Z942_9ACTN|nr:hypothetical protein GA0070621_0934 [Micromonospora narathiwatensis]
MPQPTPHHRPRPSAATAKSSESTIQAKIERSSLGTADARAMRARTSTATARAIVARAAGAAPRTPHSNIGRKTGQKSGG